MAGKLIKKTIYCFLIVLFSSFSLAQEPLQADGSMRLPGGISTYINSAKQIALNRTSAGRSFQKRHPSWSIQWNEATGTPHRAFGRGIPLTGFAAITQDNIEDAARLFIEDELRVFGVQLEHLKLIRAVKRGNYWYVGYRQEYAGIEVLLSEVELRIHDSGNVSAFGISVYSIENISTTPTLSSGQIEQASVFGLKFDHQKDSVEDSKQLYILPIRQDNSISYHLVYETVVKLSDLSGNYFAYVNAHNGELLWRKNLVLTIDTDITVQSAIREETPTEPYQLRGNGQQYVTVNGVQLTTDSLGQLTTDVVFNAPVTATLRGSYARVFRQDAPNARVDSLIVQGDSMIIIWNDFNSHPAERNVFYHTNRAHGYLKMLDPQFVALDYEMPCQVNNDGNCNAVWNGNGMSFLSAGGGCANTGQMPSVVYHEYGHGVNQYLYQENGSSRGMINDAANEGTADVNSAMIEDENRVGRGFTGPNTLLRDLANFRSYPNDVTGAIHSDGLILGGAFWDLRLLVGLEKARELAHFSKYGLPDDVNLGVCYSEWFVEVLIADDDDGDLANGTPNSDAIIQAFNKHGIGTQLFITLNLRHEPLANTLDTLNAYRAEVSLPNSAFIEIDSLLLIYSVDNFLSEQEVLMQHDGVAGFEVDLPAQTSGSIVHYYLSAKDGASNIKLRFPSDNGSYAFLVGYEEKVFDNMEEGSGWLTGIASDNATTGLWELADPEGTSIGSQPEDDHSENGELCFITGAASGTVSGQFDVDGGATTLQSPVFDISKMTDPIVTYYKWYSNDLGATPGSESWVVRASVDGVAWVDVENTSFSSSGWEKVTLRISDFLDVQDSLQFRFIASDEGAGTLVEAGLDDFSLLSQNTIQSPEPKPLLPVLFALDQNFPNPFNPTTTIPFALPEASNVTITVYDLLGRRLRHVIRRSYDSGFHSAEWNGETDAGNQVSSGIYVYRIQCMRNGNVVFTDTRKLLLLR
ncbi:MAG: T9SS type A sorting domain-containing protein [Calditrichia bacterium]